MEKLLKTPQDSRAFDTVQQIDKILFPRILDYSKLPEPERFNLCQLARIETFKKVSSNLNTQDRCILFQDHSVSCMHLMLVGEIDIFRIDQTQTEKLHLLTLNGGCMFGNIRIKVPGATRGACVIAVSDVVVLTIHRGENLIDNRGLHAFARWIGA